MNRSRRARTLLRLIAATGLLVFLGMAVLLELRPGGDPVRLHGTVDFYGEHLLHQRS